MKKYHSLSLADNPSFVPVVQISSWFEGHRKVTAAGAHTYVDGPREGCLKVVRGLFQRLFFISVCAEDTFSLIVIVLVTEYMHASMLHVKKLGVLFCCCNFVPVNGG